LRSLGAELAALALLAGRAWGSGWATLNTQPLFFLINKYLNKKNFFIPLIYFKLQIAKIKPLRDVRAGLEAGCLGCACLALPKQRTDLISIKFNSFFLPSLPDDLEDRVVQEDRICRAGHVGLAFLGVRVLPVN
jgi:hypothetical protein